MNWRYRGLSVAVAALLTLGSFLGPVTPAHPGRSIVVARTERGKPDLTRPHPSWRGGRPGALNRPMYLGPTEEARLAVFTAAQLARRLLDRGLALNAPEATALVCDEMHLAARAGATLGEVLDAGRRALRRDQLLDGVPELVGEIRLEVLLDEGTVPAASASVTGRWRWPRTVLGRLVPGPGLFSLTGLARPCRRGWRPCCCPLASRRPGSLTAIRLLTQSGR
jgi:urease gamma subunit